MGDDSLMPTEALNAGYQMTWGGVIIDRYCHVVYSFDHAPSLTDVREAWEKIKEARQVEKIGEPRRF